MITRNYMVLTPAYGRDYRSKRTVIADFKSGKDFMLHDITDNGYISIRDFAPDVKVNLRYNKRTMVVIHTV